VVVVAVAVAVAVAVGAADTALATSAVSASMSWSEGIMIGVLEELAGVGAATGRGNVSALAAVITGAAIGLGVDGAGVLAARSAARVRSRSRRSGSWTL